MDDRLKVLIVEDNRTNLMLMEMLVKRVPNCTAICYATPADLLRDLPSLDFDIGIVDFQMPGTNGIEVIETIRNVKRFAEKPYVMVTADRNSSTKMSAIEAGVIEFLHKPIDPIEFQARIRNIARLSEAQRKLADHAEWLRAEVDKATLALRKREEEIVNRLAIAAGYKDRETAAHTVRMAQYSAILARHLGLSDEQCRDIQLAAPMHDIGKVGIRDDILLKDAPLTPSERQHMNEHSRIGGEILAGSECDLLVLAAEIAETHHERWDGAGYPNGLQGNEIPLVGRIAAVADVFDALTTGRPYKDAWSTDDAFDYLREHSGKHFDPDCVAAFIAAAPEVNAVRAANPDEQAVRRRHLANAA